MDEAEPRSPGQAPPDRRDTMFSSPAATISFPSASAGVAPQAAGSPQDQTRLAGVAAAQLAALDSSMYAGQFVALAQLFAEARWASLDDAPTSVDGASLLVEMEDADLEPPGFNLSSRVRTEQKR